VQKVEIFNSEDIIKEFEETIASNPISELLAIVAKQLKETGESHERSSTKHSDCQPSLSKLESIFPKMMKSSFKKGEKERIKINIMKDFIIDMDLLQIQNIVSTINKKLMCLHKI